MQGWLARSWKAPSNDINLRGKKEKKRLVIKLKKQKAFRNQNMGEGGACKLSD